ncbi:mitochondrial inner membrane protein Mitofilin [Hygrophoropsis aurantiaca]|uniref:Mitochondrial inner membrane protein Mitofilin n=1 Tax=Hygrophoropsis aurantiaca TaxID=72124 RepID=A0ACB8ALU0_9AGAM|nr:mitochondrial inner membrane protein Mitofilin [Hygrophoropsis aurantiaca]
MYRAIPVTRQVSSTAGRGLVRITRRRLATTTPSTATKQSKSVVRKILFYSVAATGTFYVGSAFVSFENQRYRDLFTENVPMGQALVEYGEAHKWDELTIEKVVVSSVDTFKHVSDFVQQQLATFSQNSSEKDKDGASEKARAVKEITSSAIQESKVRVKAAAAALKTAVKKSEDNLLEGGAKAGAIARHQAAQLNDSIDDLIRRAEAALADKTIDPLPEATTTPAQPESSPPDSTPPRANDVEAIIVSDPNVYDASLPIGFEPPPGYSRPAPKKDAPKPTSLPVESAHEPLPLVAPVVSTLAASEPVISQLASTIDNLASYINSNPAAAEKAKSVLETAKTDITQLAERMEKIKENEQLQLQQRLDEQTREYSLKLVELEMQAQDTLDNQQEDFRKFYDSEKARFQQIYREKLDQELKTQIELINERLKEEVIAQGIEMQRRWIREVKVRVEQERGGRLAKLDELASNLKRLERIALDNSSYLDENIRIHGMWTAIRAMHAAVEAPTRKPFREELRVLRHIAAAKDDTVISSALESLESSDVPDVGVEPFADLASWFTTSVAPRVSSVALVPDQNAGVLSHLASHLLSSFRFQRHGLVQGSDVLSVLSRAEYFMNEKDLDNAARELNQLQGTAKVLLQDWLEAARKRLEVQQALEVIQSQATVASLLVV